MQGSDLFCRTLREKLISHRHNLENDIVLLYSHVGSKCNLRNTRKFTEYRRKFLEIPWNFVTSEKCEPRQCNDEIFNVILRCVFTGGKSCWWTEGPESHAHLSRTLTCRGHTICNMTRLIITKRRRIIRSIVYTIMIVTLIVMTYNMHQVLCVATCLYACLYVRLCTERLRISTIKNYGLLVRQLGRCKTVTGLWESYQPLLSKHQDTLMAYLHCL